MELWTSGEGSVSAEEVTATVKHCDPSWGLEKTGFSGDPKSKMICKVRTQEELGNEGERIG